MKKITLLLLLTVALTGCTGSKQIRKVREDILQKEQWRNELPAETNEAVRPIFPEVKRAKLKNGLQIMVVEDSRLPIAQVSLVLKHGSANDPLGKSGLNFLTAAMLKEGTNKMTSLELAEAFANLGTEVSVSAVQDVVEISSGVLSSKVPDTMSLIAAMVQNPRMEQADFDRIKFQHINLLSSYQGIASYVAQTKFLQAAYGEKHPYAYPSSGTLKNVSDLTLADIKKAHQDNFGADTAALIVVGDVKLKDVEEQANKYFAHWKKTPSSPLKIVNPAPNKGMRTILVERNDSPQTYVLVGQPVADRYDPDLAALQVLQNILAGSPASRLDANLREAKGWTYGVATSASPLKGKGPALVGSSIQVPYGADALSEMLKEFDKLSTTLVTDVELATAKNNLLRSFAANYSTLAKISDALADKFIYGLSSDSDEKFYDNLAKVSKEDIKKVSARIFNKDQLTAVAVGDLEALEPSMAKASVGKITIEREASTKEKKK